ncbi:TetR/AcrR family transcriptional regulator [Herbidospora mongoliensis]|uniref:TetR/AcrR family transcriptional regulator n=1 Tax=Herbidospora mongoliensis TaxID=688067 RepID=UPI000A03B270|nr:TetR/AcrR family transcriptional regulator [Herbidospora mongoliensis]
MTDQRARNKQATREAITQAALQLAIEFGPNGLALVRVHDIASAAGVSPRTYNNYFSSREEAICGLHADQSKRAGEALRARPADEPLGVALTEAMVELFTDPEPDRAGLRMIMLTPELEGEALKAFTVGETSLAEAIGERTGQDGLCSEVTAAAVVAAIRVAGKTWLTPAANRPFADVIRQALGCVLRG